MNRGTLLAAAALLACLGLTGCGSAGVADPVTHASPTPQNVDEDSASSDRVIRPYVDGTQLTCVRDVYTASGTSISCNWEAWNKARATK